MDRYDKLIAAYIFRMVPEKNLSDGVLVSSFSILSGDRNRIPILFDAWKNRWRVLAVNSSCFGNVYSIWFYVLCCKSLADTISFYDKHF